jgi:hypothetical protein
MKTVGDPLFRVSGTAAFVLVDVFKITLLQNGRINGGITFP